MFVADALSRRSFLAGLAAAAVAASLDPFEFVTTSGRHYRNARLGLSVTMPADWEYSSIADFVALRSRQVLLDEVAGEIHPMKDPEVLPVFLFEDPTHRRGPFAPAIGLYDEPSTHAPLDPEARHAEVQDTVGRLSYRDYERLSEPVTVRLGSAPATVADWSYRHEIDGDARQLWVRTYIVRWNGRFHTLHLVDDLAERHISAVTWREFERSVRFD